MSSVQLDYNEHFKVEAILLRKELLAREGQGTASKREIDESYEYAGIGGHSIERIAADLETLARLLPRQ